MSNIAAYFGETIKSGSGIVATADYSGTTSVAGLYGPTGVGGYASGQFQFVTIESYNGTGSSSASAAGAVVVTTAGQGGVKVLGNKPQQGDPCQLYDLGEVKIVAGAALSVGQIVMSDANGRAVPWVQDGNNVPVGECRVPANQANDIVTIFMFPNFGGENTFSSAGNVTPVASTGATVADEMANVATGVASGIVNMPPAVPGAIFFFNDAQGATHGTEIKPSGTDTIRNGSPGTITTSSATTDCYLFWCAVTGNWEYIKTAS